MSYNYLICNKSFTTNGGLKRHMSKTSLYIAEKWLIIYDIKMAHYMWPISLNNKLATALVYYGAMPNYTIIELQFGKK